MDITQLTDDDFAAIYTNRAGHMAAERYPFYPLDAPGMPVPGDNFLRHASNLGDSVTTTEGTGEAKHLASVGDWLKKLYLRCLYQPEHFLLPVLVKGRVEETLIVTGHLWGGAAEGPRGPDEAREGKPRIMIVGKAPDADDMLNNRSLSSDAASMLRGELLNAGAADDDLNNAYVTNVVRWPNLNPQGGALAASWVKDCAPLLHQELRLFRPDYILCLGAEAVKAIMGAGHSVKSMVGRYEEIDIPLHEVGEDEEYQHIKVMSVTHPLAVLRTTELLPSFRMVLKNFVDLTQDRDFTDGKEPELVNIYKLRDLQELVDEILAQPGLKKIAVDAEWHGDHPDEPRAFLRTVQISHKAGFGATIVLRHAGGAEAFMPGKAAAMAELTRLLDRDDVQIGGSFFAADLPWLESNGCCIKHRFTVPLDIEEVRGGNYAGGFDIALGMHAFDETGEFKLEVMASRFWGAVRWDGELRQWLTDYCKENNLTADELEGFGDCPDEILLPYAGKDAVYTREGMDAVALLLNSDRYGNDSWLPFQVSMLAFLAFNEMGTTGVKIDYTRIDDLTDTFMEVREDKLEALRRKINWPDFNPRSAQQCREFLFGAGFSGKRDANGVMVSVAPAGATTLNMTPVKTTGARGTPWARIRDEAEKYSASTDKETLGILGLSNELALQLRDVRLIDQVTKSVFRPPLVVAKAKRGEVWEANHPPVGSMVYEGDGRRKYPGGIASFACHDMRVRSFFSQVKETGRASSSRPPLQNLSKRREDDYRRILGDRYHHKIRSFMTSNWREDYVSNCSSVITEPTVLIEADYSGAELFGMAVMARDDVMIDHCLRAGLPDDDPRQYDIHSNVAVLAFNLDTEPTKRGLEELGQSGKRVGAKNIIFGVGYGRSAESCARQAQEEGTIITTPEAQVIINTILELYSGIPRLQEALRARVTDPGWMRNCFGRYRRFIPSTDRQAMGELERQALNFPFQSMVADAVSYSLYHLYHHPRRAALGYRIVLQVHDAVILEVPARSVDVVYNEILPECMVEKVSFKSCDLDGKPFADSEDYRFNIDRDVMTRWGEKMSWEECDLLGVDRKYGKEIAIAV